MPSFALVMAGGLLAQMMDRFDHNNYGGWFIAMIIILVIVAIAVALLLIFLVRPGHTTAPPQAGKVMPGQTVAPPQAGFPESPLDIAKRRYASGEISSEEFEKIKRALTDG